MPPVRPSARGARHHPVAAAARLAASLAQPAGSRQLSACGQLTGTGSENSSGHASTRHLIPERSTRDGSSAGLAFVNLRIRLYRIIELKVGNN